MANDGKKHEIHVLLVAFAAQGHINPMLRFGERLLSKGLHVTLATTEHTRQRMRNSGALAAAAAAISGIDLAFYSDGFSLEADRNKDVDGYMDTLASAGPTNLSNLVRDLFNPRRYPHKKLSCIVANPFVPWAADVAAAHGVPCTLLWIQPCILYAIYYRFFNGLNRFPDENNPDLLTKLPGMPPLSPGDLPSFVLPSNPFGSFPKLLSDIFRNMSRYKFVLGNSFYRLETDVIESVASLCPIMPIGPLVPAALLGGKNYIGDVGFDMWKAEDKCAEWLSRQEAKSVVYVSFGSIVTLSAKQMEEIARGLKNSGRPFLWVAKPPEHEVAEGVGKVPAGFAEEVGERGLVVPWCPQTAVLAHPAVGCFVTHCGWNSMLEAIAAGVPMIAFPQWTDQPTNAKLLVDVLGVGTRLRAAGGAGVVGREELERCVEEMMSGPSADEYRRKAVEMMAAAREGVDVGGSSERNIQLFVNEIRGENGVGTRCVGQFALSY